MYFHSKSDAEVLLPTQPPFSWLILDFLHTWKKIQEKALTASALIWQSYRTTAICQSPVVSWDTAGALCASSNDALAPKPSLNAELSSDKGFVRSNAVV